MNGDEITHSAQATAAIASGPGEESQPRVMKVNVLVSRQDEFHVDTLDL